MIEVTQAHYEGLAPIIVFDENGKLVDVMLCKPENLNPSYIWFPWDENAPDQVAHHYKAVDDAEKPGFMKIEHTLPVVSLTPEQEKEIEMRIAFEDKLRAEKEAAFEQFKQTEGK